MEGHRTEHVKPLRLPSWVTSPAESTSGWLTCSFPPNEWDSCCTPGTAQFPLSSALGCLGQGLNGAWTTTTKSEFHPLSASVLLLQLQGTCYSHAPPASLGKAALNTGHSGKRQRDSQACKFYHLHLFIHILETPLYATPTLLDALIRLCKPLVLMRRKKGSTLSLCCASFFQVDSQHWHYSVFQDSCSSDEQLPTNITKAVVKRKSCSMSPLFPNMMYFQKYGIKHRCKPRRLSGVPPDRSKPPPDKEGQQLLCVSWLGQKPSPQHVGKGCSPEPGRTWGWVGPVSPPPLPLLVFTEWWVPCTETGSWGKSAHY